MPPQALWWNPTDQEPAMAFKSKILQILKEVKDKLGGNVNETFLKQPPFGKRQGGLIPNIMFIEQENSFKSHVSAS